MRKNIGGACLGETAGSAQAVASGLSQQEPTSEATYAQYVRLSDAIARLVHVSERLTVLQDKIKGANSLNSGNEERAVTTLAGLLRSAPEVNGQVDEIMLKIDEIDRLLFE